MDSVHIMPPNWLPDLPSYCLQLKWPILEPCAQALCLDQVSSISNNNNNNRAIKFPLHFNAGWSFNVSGVDVMWFIDLTTNQKLILTIRVPWWSNIQNDHWIHNFGCPEFLHRFPLCMGCAFWLSCDMAPLLGIRLESNSCLQASWIVLLVIVWIM